MTDISIHKLNQEEIDTFVSLLKLFEDVFEMKDFKMPPADHLEKLLSKKDFVVFVAKLNNQVVGGLTVYVLDQYYAEQPLAYIFDLVVNTELQRKGIGKQLISAVNSYCKEQGFEEVFVQADRVDQHAVNFYRSTQPTEEEDVLHFYYSLNER